uniref:Uncharacterized protein n=1 Tax=Glossina brevipalpis TaxID=37001 RepID=A0A1A9X4N8_9MUSC
MKKGKEKPAQRAWPSGILELWRGYFDTSFLSLLSFTNGFLRKRVLNVLTVTVVRFPISSCEKFPEEKRANISSD